MTPAPEKAKDTSEAELAALEHEEAEAEAVPPVVTPAPEKKKVVALPPPPDPTRGFSRISDILGPMPEPKPWWNFWSHDTSMAGMRRLRIQGMVAAIMGPVILIALLVQLQFSENLAGIGSQRAAEDWGRHHGLNVVEATCGEPTYFFVNLRTHCVLAHKDTNNAIKTVKLTCPDFACTLQPDQSP